MGRYDEDEDDDEVVRESKARIGAIIVVGALAVFGIISGAMWLASSLHPA